jgi:hypothetical protein
VVADKGGVVIPKWHDVIAGQNERERILRLKQLAAHEMYEALKDCEEYFDSRADADHNGERYVGNAEMDFLVMIRAAIAKAEGKA